MNYLKSVHGETKGESTIEEDSAFQEVATSKSESISWTTFLLASEAIQTLASDIREVLRIEFLNGRSILKRGGLAKGLHPMSEKCSGSC
jgi:hypothetical protein